MTALADARAEVQARFQRLGIPFSPTLARLFAADEALIDVLYRTGIDLSCNAYDVIGEAETEHADFAGFCTNGCGDVYGIRNGAGILFWHEDESFEPFAPTIDAWLARILDDAEPEDAETIRAALRRWPKAQ